MLQPPRELLPYITGSEEVRPYFEEAEGPLYDIGIGLAKPLKEGFLIQPIRKRERVVPRMELCASLLPLLAAYFAVLAITKRLVNPVLQSRDLLSISRDSQVSLALLWNTWELAVHMGIL